jgi:acetate---CoA ligase (ADP-forming)
MVGLWRAGSHLADVIVAFSELACELGDVLDAAEANPVIASAGGVVAVDALTIVRGRIGE